MSPVMSETEIDYLKFSQPFFTLKNNENIEQINNIQRSLENAVLSLCHQ